MYVSLSQSSLWLLTWKRGHVEICRNVKAKAIVLMETALQGGTYLDKALSNTFQSGTLPVLSLQPLSITIMKELIIRVFPPLVPS